MPTCSSCGSEIPEGQGKCCSMCYGDIAYGTDGYYEAWAREQEDRQYQKEQEEYEYQKEQEEYEYQKQFDESNNI